VAKKRADREGVSSYLDSYLDRQESRKRTSTVDPRFLQNVMRTTFSSKSDQSATQHSDERRSSSSRYDDRSRSSRRRSSSRSRSRSHSRDRHRRRRSRSRSRSRERYRSRSPVASSRRRSRSLSRSPSPKRQKIDGRDSQQAAPISVPSDDDEFGPTAAIKSKSAEDTFADDPDEGAQSSCSVLIY
jgi:hypothetical protein